MRTKYTITMDSHVIMDTFNIQEACGTFNGIIEYAQTIGQTVSMPDHISITDIHLGVIDYGIIDGKVLTLKQTIVFDPRQTTPKE